MSITMWFKALLFIVVIFAFTTSVGYGQQRMLSPVEITIHSFTPSQIKSLSLLASTGSIAIHVDGKNFIYKPKQSANSTEASDIAACCLLLDQLWKCSKFHISLTTRTPDPTGRSKSITATDITLVYQSPPR